MVHTDTITTRSGTRGHYHNKEWYTRTLSQQGVVHADTITTRSGTRIEVNVYRTSTHTERYLDFNSHYPVCHKRSVLCILLRRAKNIPSTQKRKREETKPVKAVLRENNYPSSFMHKCERSLSKPPADVQTNGLAILPYVQGISEQIGRILRQQQVKVTYKPFKTVNSLFPRLKAQNDVDRPKSGVVYKINCTSCNFVYYGQTERALKTEIAEHKRAVAMFDSKVSWILMPSMWLDMSPIITSASSWKPGCPLRIRTLGTTTLLSQRSTNPWHANKSRSTFLFETLHFTARALNVLPF